MANPQLVPSCDEAASGSTGASSEEVFEPTASAEIPTSTDKNVPDGMQAIRRSFELQDISGEVREFLINSW